MKVTKFITATAFAAILMSFSMPGTNAPVNVNNAALLKGTALVWKTETIDLGDIAHNKPVKVKFEFTNSSSGPVIISNVTTSCGCTEAEYPKAPVLPKGSAEVSVSYNAAAIGAFSKTITVILADNETTKLVIKGTVME